MIIKKQHAALLQRLNNKWKEGAGLDRSVDSLKDEELEAIHHLYLSGLINENNGVYTLTHAGELVVDVLSKLLDAGNIPEIEKWDESFRWIGSEVMAMIEVGLLSRGKIEGNIKKALTDRGFVTGEGTLSPYASSIWDAYNEADVKLKIDSRIGEYIRKMPPGPGFVKYLPGGSDELLTLESMRLVAFSVPDSNVFALTGLGQQIRAAIINGTPFGDIYLDEEMLDVVMELYEKGTSKGEQTLKRMQSLGYVDASYGLLPAGKHLLSAAKIYFEGPITTNPSIHLTEEETYLLSLIKELSPKKESYISMLEEKLKKINDGYDVYEGIYALESYELVKPIEEQNRVIYVLTDTGRKTQEQLKKKQEIDAFGVKAITVSRMEYNAPDVRWLEIAEKEGLVGKAFPSKKGRFLSELALTTGRYPYVNGDMRDILHLVPYEKGITLKELVSFSGKTEKEVLYLLERLDAQGIIDALPDNVFTLTEMGKYIKRAIRAVPSGTKHVITPVIGKLLMALWELSDGSHRIPVSKNLKKVEKILGLPGEIVEKEILIAKRNRFLNDREVLEPGKVLLDALSIYEDVQDVWEEVIE